MKLPSIKLPSSLILALLALLYAHLLASNINQPDSLVRIAGEPGCYRYLSYSNGHIVENLDTGELSVYYIRRIVRVTSCK
jgi:hypothetical protein